MSELTNEEQLLEAARKNDDVQVRVILTRGEVEVGYSGEDGNTALHFAALNRNLGMVEILKLAGADLFRQNMRLQTPAQCYIENDPIVKALSDTKVELAKLPGSIPGLTYFDVNFKSSRGHG